MSVSQILTLIGLNVVGALTPGPDIFLILRLATRSRRHAYACILGIATGLLLWVTATVFGAAALLRAYPGLLRGIQVVGGAWIIWMGIGMLRAAGKSQDNSTAIFGTPMACYRQGLATNLANPKAVLYFAAIIAPLMPADPSLLMAGAIILMIIGTALLTFFTLATVVSTPKMQEKFFRAGRWIDLGAGTFFVLAGAFLIFGM